MTKNIMQTHGGADIIDMDNGIKLQYVISINPESGEVICACWPLRESLRTPGEIDTYTIQFRSIYPIYAGSFRPYLVHCYGRQMQENKQCAPK